MPQWVKALAPKPRELLAMVEGKNWHEEIVL